MTSPDSDLSPADLSDPTDPGEAGAPEVREASSMDYAESRAAWARAARPVLESAAGRYRALVTFTQLSKAIQSDTGITTSQPPAKWLGDVLSRVAAECESRGEPLLSSLCVTAQGSVGSAYAGSVEHARGEAPADPDEHAATERLECYRHWHAAGLPSDGGTALRTAHFAAAAKKAPAPRATRATRATSTATPKTTRASSTAAAAAPRGPRLAGDARSTRLPDPQAKPVPVCPRCFTQVPATGICDYCD
ncbi:MAG: hypothetical protein JWR20_1962 [Marmoricola sp.]|nr:hypothetical protein [Marmoricola sp.]